MPTKFKITVPGSTSNLGAGFDTLGLALKIYLTAIVTTDSQQTEIKTTGHGAENVPSDDTNLIYSIYKQGCEFLGVAPRPLKISVENDIPLSRGLGSSGAAVVCGLVIANELNEAKLTNQQIAEMAARIEGHPENVTASCFGGLTISSLKNDKLNSCKINPPAELKTVVLIPEIEIQTKDARRLLPEVVPLEKAVANIQRSSLMVAAMASGCFDLLREAVADNLHQPFRKRLIPGFDEICEAAYGAGAHAAFISGSGSGVIALVSEQAHAVEQAFTDVAAPLEFAATTQILEIEKEGYKVDEVE
ncbi:MAG: homoserine kinase [Calditrichaeota bacterium]|nr:MAG: homoserine kinase [Calditrichota bacterium]